MATEKVTIPDFGDVQDITVVDVYVSPGDRVEVEDPLIALESEKAVMDIPSTAAGIVREVYLKEEDDVSSGDAIVLLETSAEEEETAEGGKEEEAAEAGKEEEAAPQDIEEAEKPGEKPGERSEKPQRPEEYEQPVEARPGEYHATPSVRAYAREQGVELANLKGTGPKGRILREDVDKFQKGGRKEAVEEMVPETALQPKPLEDFSKYGEVEEVPLGRIKKISGPQLQRSWVTVPHVTHFDEADVTELEAFRRKMNGEAEEGLRYSALVFITKAVVAALKAFPAFNSSLVPGGESLIHKYFYNIGIAVDTPDGLMVPVIRNADKKGMREIAGELKRLSGAAREGKLAISDLQGASFTISSLGGIGGTGFAPIVNAPQVAILGLSRNYLKPVWHEEQQVFRPRLTLPFSLSYDHRVIDGAEAARFCRYLSLSIEDLRRALL